MTPRKDPSVTPRKPGPETLGEYRLHPDLIPNLEPIDSVKPHPGNAKVGNVEEIRASMRAVGIYRPVIAQKSSGYIVAGRHTWQAIKDGGGDAAPIVWVDVDDEEASRIRLADNRTAEIGGYNDELLLEALESLNDLAGTGYDDAYVDALRATLHHSDEWDGDDLQDALDAADKSVWPEVKVKVRPDVFEEFKDLPGETDEERFYHLMGVAVGVE